MSESKKEPSGARNTRVYYVNDNGEARLIDAVSIAHVRCHLTQDIDISLATHKQIVEMMTAGKKLEKA